jgi:hypothetical protein
MPNPNRAKDIPRFVDTDTVTWDRASDGRLQAHASGSGSSCCCSFLTDGESEFIFLDGQPITVCDLEA